MAEALDPLQLNLGRMVKKIIKSRTSVFQGKKVEYFKGKDIILALSKKKLLSYKDTKKEFKTVKQVTDFCDE